MLVLTRRTGQNVMIGDDVVVRVLDVRGDVVRLGIEAPRSTKVHREEVYEAVREANAAAAAAVTDYAAASLAAQLSRPKPNRSAG